jgi:hypothetical protein
MKEAKQAAKQNTCSKNIGTPTAQKKIKKKVRNKNEGGQTGGNTEHLQQKRWYTYCTKKIKK